MIASVLHLDRKAVTALRITDPYSLHRVVYSLYDDVRSDAEKKASKSSGIQYADMGGDFDARRILLLANREPAKQVKHENAYYGEVQSRPVAGGFLDHNLYRFKVIINPTRRDHKSRKLVAVKGREDISQWFCERSQASWGFQVLRRYLQIGTIKVQRFTDKNNRLITLGQAQVQGELLVRDPEKFRQSFQQGIGRARTYGCGLLQLVPVFDSLFD